MMTQKSNPALFINGTWQTGKGKAFHAENPANGDIIWQGNSASPDDVNTAIMAARNAFPAWAKRDLNERIEILERFAGFLNDHRDALARTISLDAGKPHWEALTEIGAMAGKIAISIKAYHDRTGTHHGDAPGGGQAVLRHKPHGVVAVFGPYNFPGHLPNGHIVPALLAGNCVVFKPSELTPLVAGETVKLWQQAGLPGGVLNLVQGERETGIALAQHPGIDGLFFTGSVPTGRHLHHAFAGQMDKILALELGGNNPLVAWDAADLDAVAHHTVMSAFITAGQRCTCARRLIVPSGARGDAMITAINDYCDRLIVGAPDDDPEPFMGPVISNRAADGLIAAQAKLVADGAKIIREMTRPDPARPFLTPGLIDVTDVKDRADEELFGPLLQIIRVDHFDDAIREANNTRFGLAAGLLCDDARLWQRFIHESRAGIVNWNKQLTGASSAAPFGGIGESGNHRPSAYYAADYCAWPVATLQTDKLVAPDAAPKGVRP
ncbi:succinylglutamate-semialdehyde dehydrogenase [Thalassospira xiamenensis]|uniref:succinylglutamate-semialdehyde dehydrogenase n=1 Tax=Thalassospira xiamenensis TaxID=220697 RepID=UPI00215D7779|nr:succinylglutamate-semialdehyde dehydrogenase [Thalassospira xiamenensis]